MWVVTELDWENFLLQMLHLNGFSPEWVLQWAVRLAAWLNDLLHWEHLMVDMVTVHSRKIRGSGGHTQLTLLRLLVITLESKCLGTLL